MQDLITNYFRCMRIEKNASPNTIGSYSLELDKFSCFLDSEKVKGIGDCTTSIVRKYLYCVYETRKISSNSMGKVISILKSFFGYLEEEGLVDSNPTRKIKFPKRHNTVPKLLSKNEIERVLNSIKFAPPRCRKNYIRDKLVISMLYYTGIRRSELLSLNWDDLNLEKSSIIIKSGKGGKTRMIPLHSKLIELLEKYLTLRLPLKSNALFIGESGNRLCKCSFINILKMCLRIAGFEKKGYTAHSFRHYGESYIMGSEAIIVR